LREQTSAAERAVLDFKAKNNIVAAGGRLMSDQQLVDLNGQLGTTRARTQDLEARLDRIDAILKTDQSTAAVDETISEAMSSGIITKLRTQYLDLVTREADWSTRYGKSHIAVTNLRKEIRDIRKSMFDELARIRESHRSDLEISRQRQNDLEKKLTGLVSQSQETNQAQVTLFSLEAAAQSYRKLYDNFLQRHTESVQQQTFPISDARQVSLASVAKTGPRASVVWMVAIFAGAMLGGGLAALRELMDRGFRTREQVRSVLATECLAMVPRLTDGRARRMFSSFDPQKPFAVLSRSLMPVAAASERKQTRNLRSESRIWRTVVDAPSSPYAEAIRSIKLTLDMSRDATATRILGLTSCLPSEGKSTIAAAMATLIAQSGARVILVDGDVRNPSLSRVLAPSAEVGLLEVVGGRAALADAVWSGPAGNMAFLPTVVDPQRAANATELLASDAAKSLFATLQIKYDYIIVDLAPMASAMDVRAASRFVDSYLLVIEWGGTKVDAVQYALRNLPEVHGSIVGAVLNKVDLAVMGRYDNYNTGYDYYGRSRYAAAVN
jgi:succinoglycan biosynthesis transport protein ExoP